MKRTVVILITFLILSLFAFLSYQFLPLEEIVSLDMARSSVETQKKNNEKIVKVYRYQKLKFKDIKVKSPMREAFYSDSKSERSEIQRKARKYLFTFFDAAKKSYKELGRYSTDLVTLGYFPEDNQIDIWFGFLEAYEPSAYHDTSQRFEDPNFKNSTAFIKYMSKSFAYKESIKDFDPYTFYNYCETGCTASKNRFEFLVVYPVDNFLIEAVMINEKKELKIIKYFL